ncbi:helix-turn-helix domain-containing protein [Archangium violaceum]|uniref:helix-turn-helix domain-containing protein n=1 Tax=Archangium violaceum TaxID=83451 RepID=UPI002B314E9B|nr:helix-turn-helix domain-containing protein [Archangium violaceum]
MEKKVFAPSARLAPFVRTFEVVEAHEELTHMLLPEAGVIVGFRYRGFSTLFEGTEALRVPDRVITGLRATVRRMYTSAGGGIVLAKFHEAGAALFFDVPLHELFGATVALDDLVPHAELERAASRMEGAKEHAERIAIFEEFLLARCKRRALDPLVTAAARAILAKRGSVRIGELARDLHLSQDALEKRFRREVGASPKQFASIVRLRQAIDLYRSDVSLSRLSLEAGYYDQSHFIREFRAVTGDAPRRFLGAAEFC